MEPAISLAVCNESETVLEGRVPSDRVIGIEGAV